MKIEVKDLMNYNEMLSHIFLGCIPVSQLKEIKDKYIGTDGNEKDWEKESVTIPVEMNIGGVSVNPKEFFDTWKDQMRRMILDEAKKLVSEKLGSHKMMDFIGQINDFSQILEHWEKEINWDVKNPLID